MSRSIFSTNIKKCILPHYSKGIGENNQDLFKSWTINSIFEAEMPLYEKFGNKLSSAISGLCITDLFTQYGLAQRDEYLNNMFPVLSCFQGPRDSIMSFIVASKPYKMVNSEEPTCSDNIVFKKGCLIIPRGELLWSLLSIPGDKIGTSNDANAYKIYVHSVDTADSRLESVRTSSEEYKSHIEHLKITKVETKPIADENKEDQYYVTLNPFIYTRIKAYKCISLENKTLEEQYFIIHRMQLLFAQTIGSLSLLSVHPQRLLQYPPATCDQICSSNDILNVGIPSLYFDDMKRCAIKEEKELHKNKYEGFTYTGKLPSNTIVFPESHEANACKSNRDGQLHSFLLEYEKTHLPKVRDEYSEIKAGVDFTAANYFDDEQKTYWFKIIKNSYPNKLKHKDQDISSYEPNVTLSPLGVVALRDVCLHDPLIFKSNEMHIEKINTPSNRPSFDCTIENQQFPEYKHLSHLKKAGEGSSPVPRVQASPLGYSSSFVTSIGTNITILPSQN